MTDIERISVPGTYRGFTSPVAEGYQRSSTFVSASDGVRLAVDIYLPTRCGALLATTHPLVMMMTGYRRIWRQHPNQPDPVSRAAKHVAAGALIGWVNRSSQIDEDGRGHWDRRVEPGDNDIGKLRDHVEAHGSPFEYLLLHGYAVAVIDSRATGASFGGEEAKPWYFGTDLADLASWFGSQAWSDGRIGMMGRSWAGGVQYQSLSYGAPGIQAFFSQVSGNDIYEMLFPGGNYCSALMNGWSELFGSLLAHYPAEPVAGDREALTRALAERKPASAAAAPDLTGLSREDLTAGTPMTDLPVAEGGTDSIETFPLDFRRAKKAQVPIYLWGGWYDLYAKSVPLAYMNVSAPKKLTMGPWHHAGGQEHVEALRWFDHWLRNVDNGVQREPPVTYARDHSPERVDWLTSHTWPPAEASVLSLPLSAGVTAATGAIGLEPCHPVKLQDVSFVVDYSVGAGPNTRWFGHTRGPLDYSQLAAAGAHGLCFVSKLLVSALDIAGHPVLALHLGSSTIGGSVFGFLEAVNHEGRRRLLSEGCLNLLDRAAEPAPYELPSGVDYHSYRREFRQPVVPGERMSLRIDLTPVSARVHAGERLSLAILGADKGNFGVAVFDPPTVLTLISGISTLELPVLSQSVQALERAYESQPPGADHAFRATGD